MEQQQFDLMLAAQAHQLLLCPILRPGRRRGAGILGRVGITDHHFLRPLQMGTIARQQQQALDHRPGIVQVSQGFKQRYNPHRPHQPGLLGRVLGVVAASLEPYRRSA